MAQDFLTDDDIFGNDESIFNAEPQEESNPDFQINAAQKPEPNSFGITEKPQGKKLNEVENHLLKIREIPSVDSIPQVGENLGETVEPGIDLEKSVNKNIADKMLTRVSKISNFDLKGAPEHIRNNPSIAGAMIFSEVEKTGKIPDEIKTDVQILSALKSGETIREKIMALRQIMPNADFNFNADESTLSINGKPFKVLEKERRKEFEIPRLTGPSGATSLKSLSDGALVTKLMFAFSPDAERDIVKQHYGLSDEAFSQDRFGNHIVELRKEGKSKRFYVNPKGATFLDITKIAGQGAAFAVPGAVAVKLATAGKAGFLGHAGVQGAAAAASDTVQLSAGRVFGATDKSQPFSVVRAGTAASFGAGGEGLGRLVKMIRGRRGDGEEFIKSGVKTEEGIKLSKELERAGMRKEDIGAFLTDPFDGSIFKPSNFAKDGRTKEFNIPASSADISGGPSKLLEQENTVKGAFGTQAQDISAGFKTATQDRGIKDAVASAQSRIAPGGDLISNAGEGANLVKQAITNKRISALQLEKEAFDSIGNASFKGESFKGLLTHLKGSFKKGPELADASLAQKNITGRSKEIKSNINLLLSKRNTPQTMQMMEIIDTNLSFLKNPRDTFINFDGLRTFRQEINDSLKEAIKSGKSRDVRLLTIMKGKYDSYLEKSVTKALISGDKNVLEQLKKANELFSNNRKLFDINRLDTGQKDIVGRNIVKLMDENEMTNGGMVNLIFGAGDIGKSTFGVRMAGRLKTVLGETSKEWRTVQQLAFRKIIEPAIQNGKIVRGKLISQLTKAINGTNGQVVRAFFSGKQINMLKQLAREVKVTNPPVFNASGTAATSASIINTAMKKGMRGGGLASVASGDPTTGLALIMASGNGIINKFKEVMAARKATKNITGKLGNSKSRRLLSLPDLRGMLPAIGLNSTQ